MLANTLDLDNAATAEEVSAILRFASREFYEGVYILDEAKDEWKLIACILADAASRIERLL